MKFFIQYLLFYIVLNGVNFVMAQWCVDYKTTIKTRMQWINGQRLTSKRNFFGGIKYKYEPYIYSTIQTYRDYERVSVCCDGFTMLSNTQCAPVCNPTCPASSHCIRPNICECNAGYKGYVGSPKLIQCQPVCSPACKENSQCVGPNKCSCNYGYKDDGQDNCQPICHDCPANSSCTKPNHCSCDKGFEDNGSGICKAVCNKPCPAFSECTKPEECTCFENYELKDGECFPRCSEECPENSQCIKPNECDCNKGYEKSVQMNATNFTCSAKCEKECPLHAQCTRPNICECEQGYEKSVDGKCVPICEKGCPLNALCTDPNVCTCTKGYEMIEQRCQPICEKSCPEYSNCSEPNKCECEAGYQLKLSSIYNLYCEPVCQSNCSTYGKCIAPNKCECLDGYEMDEMEICQPICKGGCKNGLCFQPEICICNAGYLMGPKNECEPSCSLPCLNGSCVEPEICQCHDGFKFQNNSINICEPVCNPACVNGICVAPNVCICHENHEPTNSDFGLNHSDCKPIQTTTTTINENLFEESIPAEDLYSTTETNSIPENLYTISLTPITVNFTTITHPDSLIQTTAKPNLISAEICNDQCQCWREFDEYGPLVTQTCTHLCADKFDKPCLDLNLCQCNLNTKHLVCRTSDDVSIEDDPIFYMCHIERLKVTTLKPLDGGKSSDMKSVQKENYSSFPWWWPVIGAVLVLMIVMGGLAYIRCRNVEESIIEYEL